MNTTTITHKHSRRSNDFYPTPVWNTQELLERATTSGIVLECCSGNGNIAVEIASIRPTEGYLLKSAIWSADIEPKMPIDLVGNAAVPGFWQSAETNIQEILESENDIDWVVTNPPYIQASAILPLAYYYARAGVAFLLRLSYLELCKDKADWLVQHPVSRLIVLPRTSFTGDCQTDSVTCAWFV